MAIGNYTARSKVVHIRSKNKCWIRRKGMHLMSMGRTTTFMLASKQLIVKQNLLYEKRIFHSIAMQTFKRFSSNVK